VGAPRRVKYDEVLKTLGVRPLKMQALLILTLGFTRAVAPRRVKYDEVLKTLGVRPLKMQAARGVMIKLTAEDQPTVLVGENVDEAPAV